MFHSSIIFLLSLLFVPAQDGIHSMLIPERTIEFALLQQLSSTSTPYWAPNERNPYRAESFFQQLPADSVYLAVGADRGYLNAALANASRLILVDRDHGVTFFNTINTLLIRAARSGEDYLDLRLHPYKWDTRLNFDLASKNITKHRFLEFMKQYWVQVHQEMDPYFEVFYALPGESSYCREGHRTIDPVARTMSNHITIMCDAGDGQPFGQGTNPFYNDALFFKIKALASSVTLETLDISDASELKNLMEHAVYPQETIGMVDTSNIFPIAAACGTKEKSANEPMDKESQKHNYKAYQHYLQSRDLARGFLTHIKPALHADAILLVTENRIVGETDEFGLRAPLPLWVWDYKGERIEDVLAGNCR